MIDAMATERHFADHIQPVWDALPERGTFHTQGRLHPGPLTLVASRGDQQRARRRPVAYMEHGIGQTYKPGFPNYAGGSGKDNVVLFLSPSERVADLNRARYPSAAHEVVGCPLLDRWVDHRPSNPEPVISLAWHWNGMGVAPEARSAFAHYSEAIPALPYKLLGHGHPRAMGRLQRFYEEHGIEWTADFAEVLERADVLVFDNTSAGFMFAATGRPVVVLDAPWYRRAWGGRFWEWADVGVRISEPAQLAQAIAEALADTPDRARERQRVSVEIFGVLDGSSTQRAVTAITALTSERMAA